MYFKSEKRRMLKNCIIIYNFSSVFVHDSNFDKLRFYIAYNKKLKVYQWNEIINLMVMYNLQSYSIARGKKAMSQPIPTQSIFDHVFIIWKWYIDSIFQWPIQPANRSNRRLRSYNPFIKILLIVWIEHRHVHKTQTLDSKLDPWHLTRW